MRIKEIAIHRYGPLREFPRRSLSSFALFYGENEHGKTLLVDAIIRLMLKKKLSRDKGFAGLKRVQEQPEGFIVLEMDGREVKLGKDESILTYYGEEVSIQDFRNIFLARDSDLSIEPEKAYYTSLTEKLTGLRTNDMQRIRQVLRAKGKLTGIKHDSDLSDSRDYGHIAGRMRRAAEMILIIEELARELGEREFDLLERTMVEKRKALASAKRELELLEAAKKRESYERARVDLEKLKTVQRRLNALDGICQEDYDKWQVCEQALKKYEEDLKETKSGLLSKQSEIETIDEKLEGHEKEIQDLEGKKSRIDDEIRPAIKSAVQLESEAAGASAMSKFWNRGFIISLSMLFIGLAGAILRGHPFFIFFSSLCLISTLYFTVKLISFSRLIGKLDKNLGSLMLSATGIHEGEQSLRALEKSVSEVLSRFNNVQREISSNCGKKSALELEVNNLREKERKLRAEVEQNVKNLEELKIRSGQESLQEYREKLDEKKNLQLEKKKLEGALERALGEKEPNAEENDEIERWSTEIISSLREMEPGIRYDDARCGELRKKTAAFETDCIDLEERLKQGQQKLGNIEYMLQEAGIFEQEPVVCRTTADLRALRDRLHAFIAEVDENKKAAQESIRIFQEMEMDEEERVSSLFGSGEAVSSYFSEITNGFYEEVRYDSGTSRIRVKPGSGNELYVENLSGGTFDQLYLAVRLSLAGRLLKNEKGFFIMDDPFIKADYERLAKQLGILKRMTGWGWQVLYFSAKKEVRELLDEDVQAGRIQLIELPEHV